MVKLLAVVCFISIGANAATKDIAEQQQLIKKSTFHASVSIGFGGIENPVAQSENFVTPILPHLAYYGDKWYFDDFSLGYSLLESDSYYIDIAGRFNNDGFYFELDGIDKLFATFNADGSNKGAVRAIYPEYLLTPIERDLSYLAGVSGSMEVIDNVWVELAALNDVTGVHNGHEFQLNAHRDMRFNGGHLGFGVGVDYKSKKLIDYYYEVRDGEANTRLPEYELESSINYHMIVNYKHSLTQKWNLDINIKHTWLDSDLYYAAMIGKHTFFSGFAGVTYTF